MATKLINSFVANLTTPGEYTDTDIKGFSVRVTAAGTKTFYLTRKGKSSSRRVRIKLGNYPEITLSQARQLATDAIYLKAITGTPLALDKLKFGEAYSMYLNNHLLIKGRQRSIENDNYIFNKHLKSIENHHIKTLSSQDIRLLHRSISLTAPIMANRMLEVVSKVFNFIAIEVATIANPCSSIVKNKEQRRKRFIEAHEIKDFFQAVNEEYESFQSVGSAAVLLGLFTGVRRSNCLTALWSEFNLDAAIWDIPAEKFKTGNSHRVYLHPFIVRVLRGLSNNSSYVFASSAGHLKEPKSVIKRICQQSGIESKGLCFHSLRHTFTSYAFSCLSNSLLVSKLTGHALPGQAAMTYGHLSEAQIKEGFTAVGNEILKAAGWLGNSLQLVKSA